MLSALPSRHEGRSGNPSSRMWSASRGTTPMCLLCQAFSPDGQSFLSGSEDHTIRLWDLSSGQELHRLESHSASITCLAFSPDGQSFLSGSNDCTICWWKCFPKATQPLLLGLFVTAYPSHALYRCNEHTVLLADKGCVGSMGYPPSNLIVYLFSYFIL